MEFKQLVEEYQSQLEKLTQLHIKQMEENVSLYVEQMEKHVAESGALIENAMKKAEEAIKQNQL